MAGPFDPAIGPEIELDPPTTRSTRSARSDAWRSARSTRWPTSWLANRSRRRRHGTRRLRSCRSRNRRRSGPGLSVGRPSRRSQFLGRVVSTVSHEVAADGGLAAQDLACGVEVHVIGPGPRRRLPRYPMVVGFEIDHPGAFTDRGPADLSSSWRSRSSPRRATVPTSSCASPARRKSTADCDTLWPRSPPISPGYSPMRTPSAVRPRRPGGSAAPAGRLGNGLRTVGSEGEARALAPVPHGHRSGQGGGPLPRWPRATVACGDAPSR